MNLPALNPIDQYIRIPKIFFSSDTGKPFSNCLMCGKFLLQNGTSYMIEKAIKQHPEMNVTETIFDYALCTDCAVRMNAAMSVESRQRISAYFAENVNLAERRETLLQKKTLRVQPWLNKCVIKKTPIAQSPEYQLVAQFDGKHMLFTYMPFALSFEAMDEMGGLMSAQSRGEIDDFIGRYFSGPPEVAEILRKRLVLV
jgi:hypothetical protein